MARLAGSGHAQATYSDTSMPIPSGVAQAAWENAWRLTGRTEGRPKMLTAFDLQKMRRVLIVLIGLKVVVHRRLKLMVHLILYLEDLGGSKSGVE